MLILPEASLEVAAERAESLRRQIAELNVTYMGQKLRSLTASLGVAGFPENGDQQEELLRRADAALYSAKHAGRNRVVVAEELIENPDAEPVTPALS